MAIDKPTTDEPSKSPAFFSNLGTDMITIVFGKGKGQNKFLVHQNLLSQKAAKFAKILATSDLYHKKGYALLQKEDLAGFEHFLVWLYQGPPPMDANIYDKSDDCIYTIAFAEKYEIHGLADNIMDGWARWLSKIKMVPDISMVALGYNITAKNSKLRVFLSKLFTYFIVAFTDDVFRPTKSLRDVGQENADLLLDVFELLRGESGTIFPDPREPPPCDYHQHGEDEACPHRPKKA